MNEMFRYVLMVVMGVAVVLGMAVFSFTAWMEGDVLSAIIFGAITLAVAAFMAILLLKEKDRVKAGLPMYDERTNRVKQKAGYYAFLATLYFNLGVMWVNEHAMDHYGFESIRVNTAMMASMAAMTVFFAIGWFYFGRRSDVK